MTKTDVILICSIKKLSTPFESVDLSVHEFPVKQVSTVPWSTQELIVVHSNGQSYSND